MENKLKVGDKVYISDKSSFYKDGQGKDPYGKKVLGVVGPSSFSQFKYEVLWENGSSYLYNDEDLELTNVEPNYEIY